MEGLTTREINIIALVLVYFFTMGGIFWKITMPKKRKPTKKKRKS